MAFNPGDIDNPVPVLVEFPNVVNFIPDEHPQVRMNTATTRRAHAAKEETVRNKTTISVVHERAEAMYKCLVEAIQLAQHKERLG